ncbi:MAG: helix-turn-helix domain-containing protein [Streptosporangiales bacterium]|nr:helix-turn-helix domain-containing protein [Streptosporangiales bacterium]
MVTPLPADADDGKRSVLGRAFDILDCFSTEQPEQTIAGLCGQTGLPPATVHRMLAGLVEWEAVERTGRGRYRLGRRLWRLGWGVADVRLLRDAARSFMVDLYSATGELVALGTRESSGDVTIMDFIGGRSVNAGWYSGRRVPLLDSGPGLVYLAHATPNDLTETLRELCPPRWSRSDDFQLRQRLSEIKRTGVAVARGTSPGEPAWVSAPVYRRDGSVRSTLSLIVPEYRLNAVSMSRAVAGTARAITEAMVPQRARRARGTSFPASRPA